MVALHGEQRKTEIALMQGSNFYVNQYRLPTSLLQRYERF